MLWNVVRKPLRCIFRNIVLDLNLNRRKSNRKVAEMLNLNVLTLFDTVKKKTSSASQSSKSETIRLFETL